jgi:hypothetical protein
MLSSGWSQQALAATRRRALDGAALPSQFAPKILGFPPSSGYLHIAVDDEAIIGNLFRLE